MEKPNHNIYVVAINSSIELIRQVNMNGIDIDFIVGVCSGVHKKLGIQEPNQLFNTTAIVIHTLYGPEFGRKLFRKHLSNPGSHSRESYINGIQFADRRI